MAGLEIFGDMNFTYFVGESNLFNIEIKKYIQ